MKVVGASLRVAVLGRSRSTLIAVGFEVRREGRTALSSVVPTSAEREVHGQAS